VASGLAAIVGEECFDALRAPVRRVAVPSGPDPLCRVARARPHPGREPDRGGL